MSTDAKWTVGTVLTVALALAALIQSGQSETAERFAAVDVRFAAIEERLGTLDGRLRTVGQVQAQHGLLLQLLARRVLGVEADLPLPAGTAGPDAAEGEDGIAALGSGEAGQS
ncbi:MAG: hypothetical protein OXD30_12365 [Bryobacterales bacterium]|nr:hypothetical protein [Bryobacterales bacterium]